MCLTGRPIANPQQADVVGMDEVEDSKVPPSLQYQMKVIKPVLASTSKLCRAMTDLFGLLVKVSWCWLCCARV